MWWQWWDRTSWRTSPSAIWEGFLNSSSSKAGQLISELLPISGLNSTIVHQAMATLVVQPVMRCRGTYLSRKNKWSKALAQPMSPHWIAQHLAYVCLHCTAGWSKGDCRFSCMCFTVWRAEQLRLKRLCTNVWSLWFSCTVTALVCHWRRQSFLIVY